MDSFFPPRQKKVLDFNHFVNFVVNFDVTYFCLLN